MSNYIAILRYYNSLRLTKSVVNISIFQNIIFPSDSLSSVSCQPAWCEDRRTIDTTGSYSWEVLRAMIENRVNFEYKQLLQFWTYT